MFIRLRWSENNGNAYCPKCGATECYASRRKGSLRWQCKACHKDFSLTSGTLFASHKMPLRAYLMAIAVFINEVKGKSHACPLPRPRHGLQDEFRPGAQAARGDGARGRADDVRRGRQKGRNRRRDGLAATSSPRTAKRIARIVARRSTRPASARPSSSSASAAARRYPACSAMRRMRSPSSATTCSTGTDDLRRRGGGLERASRALHAASDQSPRELQPQG